MFNVISLNCLSNKRKISLSLLNRVPTTTVISSFRKVHKIKSWHRPPRENMQFPKLDTSDCVSLNSLIYCFISDQYPEMDKNIILSSVLFLYLYMFFWYYADFVHWRCFNMRKNNVLEKQPHHWSFSRHKFYILMPPCMWKSTLIFLVERLYLYLTTYKRDFSVSLLFY